MTLRRLALTSLLLMTVSLIAFALFGLRAWQGFNDQLEHVEQLSEIQRQLQGMSSAIDYITLVRVDQGVARSLNQDARRLAEALGRIDSIQTRLARDHLLELAEVGEYLLSTLSREEGSQAPREREMLLMVSRQVRVHHAGAREAVDTALQRAGSTLLETLYTGVRALVLVTLALTVMIVLAIITIYRRLLAPILALNAGLTRVSEGHLDARLDFERTDEFGNLARSFNHMAEQRQQFEHELAESETRFRQLAENIGEVFWVLDVRTNALLYTSPAFEQLWGESVEALMADPALWLRSIHPDDLARVEQALRDRPYGAYRADYRIIRPDGSQRWIHDKSSPVYDDLGRIVRVVGAARDITERMESQMRLAERIKELRCLYRVLELTAGSDLTIDEIAREVAGMLPGSLQHEQEAMARVTIGEQTHVSPNWHQSENRIRSSITVDGQTIGHVEAAYPNGRESQRRVFLAEEHALVNGVAIHLARMIKNRRLNDTLTKSERMKAVGELTGGIAHDFNNLLTVIMGNAEMLEEELAAEAPRQAELACMISKAAQRGADLTGRLLAFARRQALEPRPIDLNELVTGMEKLLKRSLGENIELKLVTAEKLWPAMADVAQLDSAILNLSLNARDAMPGGGRLTLETRNVVLDQAYASSQEEVEPGDYVLLAISDSGQGIAPELIDRVFEPFFTTKDHGSGLGLSMVYGLVKQLRGHVRIYSEPGQGTTIRLYLPRADRAASSPAEEADSTELNGSETILLVEDNELVRRYAREQLCGMGYRVVEASDAAHALVILRARDDIDLLFTDVIMPGGIDGPELARLAAELHPELPVLFTSGYSEHAVTHQGLLSEGASLLSKPYRRAELGCLLRQVLERNK